MSIVTYKVDETRPPRQHKERETDSLVVGHGPGGNGPHPWVPLSLYYICSVCGLHWQSSGPTERGQGTVSLLLPSAHCLALPGRTQGPRSLCSQDPHLSCFLFYLHHLRKYFHLKRCLIQARKASSSPNPETIHIVIFFFLVFLGI